MTDENVSDVETVKAAVLAEMRGPAPVFNIENPHDPETKLAQVVAHARHQGKTIPEGGYNDTVTAVAIAFGLDPRAGIEAVLKSACAAMGVAVPHVSEG